MFDNLEDATVFFNDEKLEYVNEVFLQTFKIQIKQSELVKVPRPIPKDTSFFQKVKERIGQAIFKNKLNHFDFKTSLFENAFLGVYKDTKTKININQLLEKDKEFFKDKTFTKVHESGVT